MKGTCTSLSEMLHKIRDRKLEKEGLVEDDMVADAMQLFAQLSGHHKTLVRQVEKEADSIDELRVKCEAEQSVLEEQLSYMLYMDKEYNVRPWKAPKDIGVVVGDSDNHPAIKDKLDSELLERRKTCESANKLEDEISDLRKGEQGVRGELEKVRKVMVSISLPSFLDGVEPSKAIPASPLAGPLYTLHQLLAARAADYNNVTISVTTEDPLASVNSRYRGRCNLDDATWTHLTPDPHLLTVSLPPHSLVIRFHPKVHVLSVDDTLPRGVLAQLCPEDTGSVSPHTRLDFTFPDPSLRELVEQGHLGRVFCWMHELCGVPVVTEKQREPSNVTPVRLFEHILKHC